MTDQICSNIASKQGNVPAAQDALEMISMTFAAVICDSDDPCSVNTEYDPESSFKMSPRSTTELFCPYSLLHQSCLSCF